MKARSNFLHTYTAALFLGLGFSVPNLDASDMSDEIEIRTKIESLSETHIRTSSQICANCLTNDQPIPSDATHIIESIADPELRKQITWFICALSLAYDPALMNLKHPASLQTLCLMQRLRNNPIQNLTEVEGLYLRVYDALMQESYALYRTHSMPGFMREYFTAVSKDQLDIICVPLIVENLLPVSSLLHMKQRPGTYWMGADSIAVHSLIHACARRDYIKLERAFELDRDSIKAKYVMAMADEVLSPGYRENINALLRHHPDLELVVDFGEATAVPNSWGKPENFPALVCNLSLVGKNLTTIGDNFLAHCTGLTCVTLPDSLTGIGYCFLTHCKGLTHVMIPTRVLSVGIGSFAGCTSLREVTATTYIHERINPLLRKLERTNGRIARCHAEVE